MENILGIDLGTNSIGITKRNIGLGDNLNDQLEYFSSVIFAKGVGNGKTGEFSYAAERTKHRSSRRLYQARKYRIWETLYILIKFDFCPLSINELDRWRKYDKKRGLKREYPIDSNQFEQWVRLDFDNDGIPEYSSPYQLRKELATIQLDFSLKINRMKLGRALYHIAQRRGFKSSKGETLKEQEKEAEINKQDFNIDDLVNQDVTVLKKSEEKKAKGLNEFIEIKRNDGIELPTVGCAFSQLENEGYRIRENWQAVRSQYSDEIMFIFKFQNQLDNNSEFFKGINKAIFYKRPLRSQKGLVGKCTLEPNKDRCLISHPEFETFRAWSFINNIKIKSTANSEWSNLSNEVKEKLFNDKFLRTKSNFKFDEIRLWIEKELGIRVSYYNKTVNYKDKTNVSGCPISGRLKNLLGVDWKNYKKDTTKFRTNNTTGKSHSITYSVEDIWHICFSFDDEENITEFAKNKLNFNDKDTKSLVNLWVSIPQGYGMLSLKAIRNINYFLLKGLIYTDAVLLAKIPEILGKSIWSENENMIINEIENLTEQNRAEKEVLNIVNNLISNYKSLEIEEQFAYKNKEYILTESDFNDIEDFIKDSYGENKWFSLNQEEQKAIRKKVSEKYQEFFSSTKRDYYKLPKLANTIKVFLSKQFSFLNCPNNFYDRATNLPCNCNACKLLNKLYHPSQIEFYKPAQEQTVEWGNNILSLKLLNSPKIGAFKNPMAMRTLHELRKIINHLIKEGIISEETRIVVETARDLNDANMRWAIEAFQREREKENKEFEAAIKELYQGTDRKIEDDEIDKVRVLIEQWDIPEFGVERDINVSKDVNKKTTIEKGDIYKKDVTKYRLWLEQGCRCLYTGKLIKLSDLFDENKIDFEHTLPRSKSFDNSLANLTVCDAQFNRHVKKNKIPAELENYENILLRLQPWEDRIEKLKDNVDFWKAKAKQAQVKESKDTAIRQRHLWQMELDYWKSKVERFKISEITSGFKNSQLVDTRIISKYALHFLKSVFKNVDVQKGSVTSDFRKILGVQSEEEKKSRDKHSHHAIDAAILTLIPTAAKRDKMLKAFYEIQETRKLISGNQDSEEINKFQNRIQELKNEIEKDKRSLSLGNISGLIEKIENTILINHVSNNQALTPAKKKARKRGKEIFVTDKNGNTVNKWITGDCIRGQLHGDTFYGAIKQAIKLDNGSFQRNADGSIKSGEEVFYVVRRELKYKKSAADSGFKDLDELKNKIVDKHLFHIIENQCNDVTFKEGCERGFYMQNKDGKKVNKIRHIRCFTDVKNPIVVKKQTYDSNKEYKKNFYSTNGENILYGLYSDNNGNSDFECISLFDAAKIKKTEKILTDIDLFPKQKVNGNKVLELSFVLKPGTRVILKNDESSINELTEKEIVNRLYKVNRIFDPNDGRIQLQFHLEARDNNGLSDGFPTSEFGKRGINGFSSPNFEVPCHRLLLSKSNLKLWVENKDFKVSVDGKIKAL